MSASQENSLTPNIKKIGIIAGSGTLPRDLYQRCQKLGIECHVVGFKGHTNYITPDFWGKIGKASKIIRYLKENEIENIIMIGGISRPTIFSLRPDWLTFKFFAKTWFRSFGDSTLLSAARSEIEKMGFKMHGVHQFLPELLMPEGLLGKFGVPQAVQDDVQFGVHRALEWGERDKGQAVIIKGGVVLARETKSGTSQMIKTYGVKDAILVKMCKPQQDPDMDLPTIGPETANLCADKQMAGIVGHAGQMLIAEQDKLIEVANRRGIFILGQVVDAQTK